TNVESQIQRAMAHLRPIFEERLEKEAEYGRDWPGRPNDAFSWLLDTAEGKQRTIRDLTMRILVINFAAIHTTSMAFTQILFDLAANPAFVPGLREEVERVIREEGLSKISFHKMVKLDSFIKESQRLGGNGAVVMQRKVLKDFTFSDGTVVPKGNDIAVANFAMHHDEENYPDPLVFDGFRFSKMREKQSEGFSKHQMVALTHEYIVFGHGKHACPGRFFAVNELKALLAYTLLNYDVSFKDNSPRPADRWFNLSLQPDPKVSVMFRKRCP
ncbi:Ent-kaurene oxidase, partial [Termitomyces sp. T112]